MSLSLVSRNRYSCLEEGFRGWEGGQGGIGERGIGEVGVLIMKGVFVLEEVV